MAEHLTVDQAVVGSTPITPPKRPLLQQYSGFFVAFLIVRAYNLKNKKPPGCNRRAWPPREWWSASALLSYAICPTLTRGRAFLFFHLSPLHFFSLHPQIVRETARAPLTMPVCCASLFSR
jgi:hypothetical protein